jgi:uncharacterized protein YbjT (DUF2867 family)
VNVLVTGANGYIGLRLILAMLEAGHTVTAVVRDPARFPSDNFSANALRLTAVRANFLDGESLTALPECIDAAYYLIHSMGAGGDFAAREKQCAVNFANVAKRANWKRIIYLGGLVNESAELSEHLASRQGVEKVLGASGVPLTVLRASIIVGSGSASFEIIRDLCEKLPVLITPRWVNTRCQPIAIRNVIGYLRRVLDHPETMGATYDIGGPDVMSYRKLLEEYCKVRGLKRWFLSTPLLTPRLSSGWLFLMTSTSFPLARTLVDSMTNETICRDCSIRGIIPMDLLNYREAVEMALARIAQNHVPSSWMGALAAGTLDPRLFDAVKVPEHGVYLDSREFPLTAPISWVLDATWGIGGANGWPSMNWAWKIRGVLDKLSGGIGLRRGRRHPSDLRSGDALDFWRVLLADRDGGRLILYAEMKLPGEAWLEFAIEQVDDEPRLRQTATFRPQGLWGRLYWFSLLPFHSLLFPGMGRKLAAGKRE